MALERDLAPAFVSISSQSHYRGVPVPACLNISIVK